MDLTVINGLGPARRGSLEEAGVADIDALADQTPETLSEEVGISAKLLTDFQAQAQDLVALRELEGIGPKNLEKLAEADVRSLKDLTTHEIADLHEATGIREADLKGWQRKAGPKVAAQAAKATAGEAQEAARELSDKARAKWEDARVKLDDEVLADVRILPIRAKDNVEKVLDRVKGNVVLLREEAETAVVRVEEGVYEGLPIFKEKVAAAQEAAEDQAREVRVRVQEIRDKRVLPKAEKLKQKVKSLFGKS